MFSLCGDCEISVDTLCGDCEISVDTQMYGDCEIVMTLKCVVIVR